jgi:phosphotransferase system HPr (HPr) family protein
VSEASADLTVEHDHGLHLRPAAQFVRTAARFRSTVSVTNATRGGKRTANARSLLEVTALAVDRGHVIRVTATGEDADDAVAALVELVRSGFA